jgi:two-component system LytT family sensor kinase
MGTLTTVPLLIREAYAIVGMAISVLLLLLLKRQPERQREWAAGVLLGTATFFLYANVFVLAASRGTGTPLPNWLFPLSLHITLSIAAFTPSIIFFGWIVSPLFKEDPPIGRSLFVFSMATATLTTLVIWFAPSAWIAEEHRIHLISLNSVLVLLPGFHALLKQKLSARFRLYMAIVGASYLLSFTLLSLSVVVAGADPRGMQNLSVGGTSITLLQQICSLVGILGSFIFVARFRFADVFIKWSLRLGTLVILATVGAVGVERLSSYVAATGSTHSLLIEAVGLFVLICSAVAIVPVTDACVEHWVLHQTDLKGGLERIISGMLAIHSETELLPWIDQRLVDCLDLSMARTMFSKTLPETLLDDLRESGDVMELSNILSRSFFDELRNIEMLVPVAVDGHMRYVIALCPGLGRRTLLSGEVQFLRTVARQVGVHIHHLEGEAAARQQALRESLLRNQLTEAELRALRAQVNPHFLFNSLNTIADLIVTNPTNAERMTLRLASIFRHVLAQTDRQFMSLHEEFDFTRNYLQIEQERFGPRLTVSMSLDPSIAHENIPTLLLQPLVENALKHGLAPKGGKGLLQISARRHEALIELVIADNGIGWRDGQCPSLNLNKSSRHSGVGLANTAARLHTIYGDRASINIESAPLEGCRISITYPLEVPLYALSDH